MQHLVVSVLNVILWTIIASMLLAVFSLGFYWTYLEKPPITIYKSFVTTPLVIPGGKLAITIEMKQDRECILDARHVIIDSDGNLQELMPSNTIVPSDLNLKSVSYVFDLPDDFTSGDAIIRSQFIARCNPLKTHIINVDYLPVIVD